MLETLLQPGETKERCGVLLLDGSIVEIQNVSADPTDQFRMEPKTFIALVESGIVQATWHTHPGGTNNLSGDDHDGFCAWPDLDHIIIGTNGVRRYTNDRGLWVVCD